MPYYHYMEEDDNFRRWVESVERGSIQTASVYLEGVDYISAKMKLPPLQIAMMNIKEARPSSTT